jgi:hypothetical protein
VSIGQGHVTGNDWQEIREKKTGKDIQLTKGSIPAPSLYSIPFQNRKQPKIVFVACGKQLLHQYYSKVQSK